MGPLSKSGSELEAILGYDFSDSELLAVALTHRSAAGRNYERLEFLGDAVLGFAIAAALFKARPQAAEGDLSRLRASLVRKNSLAEIAQSLDLGRHLHLGAGERRSGGSRRTSILADTLEAVLGAIYLDGGFSAAEQVVLKLFEQRLIDLPDAETLKDAKTRLQEYLQARGLPLPEYELSGVTGQDHAQTFTVICRTQQPARESVASGNQRRRAEQAAAAQLLQSLQNE